MRRNSEQDVREQLVDYIKNLDDAKEHIDKEEFDRLSAFLKRAQKNFEEAIDKERIAYIDSYVELLRIYSEIESLYTDKWRLKSILRSRFEIIYDYFCAKNRLRDVALRISFTLSNILLMKRLSIEKKRSATFLNSIQELINLLDGYISQEEVTILQSFFLTKTGRIRNPYIIQISDPLAATREAELRQLSTKGLVKIGKFEDETRYYVTEKGFGRLHLSRLRIIRLGQLVARSVKRNLLVLTSSVFVGVITALATNYVELSFCRISETFGYFTCDRQHDDDVDTIGGIFHELKMP